MNQMQATALLIYMKRAMPMIPTTGEEWQQIQGAMRTVEGLATGLIEIKVRPAEGDPQQERETEIAAARAKARKDKQDKKGA